ncbi:MAG TPA: Uma2 family endonuclease [Steroidobacteraceae bacterium]|nr:Uma2 family endonuclease [Steroidobacteraceae bacterium]
MTLFEIEREVRMLSAGERKRLLALMSDEPQGESRVAEPPGGYGTAVPERRLFTFEEYLEIERCSPLRHEYVAGEIFAMSDPRQAHEIITMNLATALHAHLSGRPCRTYAARRRLHFRCRGDDIAYYPDVWVGCGETRNAKGELDDEPRLVIEVLSPSTEKVDRREKAVSYREIASLEEIVLVAQKRAAIVLYRRADRWSPITVDSPDAVLPLQSIGLTLPVSQIYDRVP